MKHAVLERLKALRRHAERRTSHKRVRIALEAKGRAEAYAKAIKFVEMLK